jgi:hypothetical protein
MATMSVTVHAPARAYLGGLVIILRAAAGLFVHGLRRPGAPARICPATGRVVSR